MPWSNLKPAESSAVTCQTGCAPIIDYPEDGYYHYKDSIVFEWKPVSVGYHFIVLDSEGMAVHNENLTGVITSTTKRLPEGNSGWGWYSAPPGPPSLAPCLGWLGLNHI